MKTIWSSPMISGAIINCVALLGLMGTGQAQTVEEFYSKNPITLMVGAAAGGSSDELARGIAPFLRKYIPGNPTIIIRNKPGAGGLLVAIELQNLAPRDGTYISTLQRNNYVDPLLSDIKVNFDPRQINNLGSMAKNIYTLFTYGKTPVTFADALKREIILTAPSAGSGNATLPVMLNKLVGTKFKMIYGYQGPQDEMLALERGEAEGRATGYSTTKRGTAKQWYDQGLLHHLMLFSFSRSPDLRDIPSIMEVVKDPDSVSIVRFMLATQEFGRPFAAPLGVPPDRLAALQEAFAKIAKDPDYVAELAKIGDDVDFLNGADVQKLVDELWAIPPAQLAKVKEIMATK
jgi:tripartite-type tricarboxylate transporter receptor subunit TctC